MSSSNILDFVNGEYQAVTLEELIGSYSSVTKLTQTVNSVTYNVAAYEVHVYADAGRVTEIVEGVLSNQLTLYRDTYYSSETGEDIITGFKLNSTTYEGTLYVDMYVIGGYVNSDDLDQLATSFTTETLLSTNISSKIPLVFSQTGSSLNISGIGFPSITALSSTRIAFFDATNLDLRTYDFDGTSWSQTGNDLNISGAGSGSITALSSTRIAFFDATNLDLRTYDFDGTDWSQTGNDLNIVGAGFNSIASLSSNRIVFIDLSNDDLRTYDFDGTDWSQKGNDLNISGTGFPAISSLSSTRIALFDGSSLDLRTYDFDGTDWTQTSVDLNITGVGSSSIASLGYDRIAFIDSVVEDLNVYDLTFQSFPPNPAFGTL